MRSTTRLGRALDYASDHHDLLPTRVLVAEGLSPTQIRALVTDGIIERIIRGLFRLAGTRSPLQDIAAAVFRHAGARASHTSALFVHGLDIDPPARPSITLPPGSTSGTTLGVLHRSPLEIVDCTRRQRIPVTTVARSLVDSAEMLSVDQLAAVVNEAVSRRSVQVRHIIDVADRMEAAPGRIGSGRLREVMDTWTDAIEPDSPAEAAAIRRIVVFGLPAPVTQHVVRDDAGDFVARLDMAWPELRIGREYDSKKHHGPDRIEPDERRLQRLEALGWEVEPLYRYHLLPDEVAWLHALRRQLARSVDQAS
jgi:predicted transcriptional regulator of viral defense system